VNEKCKPLVNLLIKDLNERSIIGYNRNGEEYTRILSDEEYSFAGNLYLKEKSRM
jgi:hypothetical protein